MAGGLSAKLPQGAEHRSVGQHNDDFNGNNNGFSSFTSSGSSAGGSIGFNGNGRFSNADFRSDGGQSFGAGGNTGFNSNNGAGFNGNNGAGFSSNAGSSFGANSGQFDASANSGGQFDDGSYRPDETNGQYDDGTWKPSLYSGDDGLYKDEQYAPNTDASYQFQFDLGDHGRDEAADRDGEVQGSFYAVHPDGIRRDVEFSAGREGFVVTRDESVQGPVPEYALRQAAKPRKEYPPAEIKTSLSPDGIYHWEYDAGDSARSEDINLNTNYYEGHFSFTADDDQNRYEVRYKAGAGIGFVPEGDHLPMQVQETPEVAEAKAAFLEKFAVAEAEARQRPNAYKGNGFQRSQVNNGNGFQRSQVNNGNGFQRPQVNNGNGFQRSQVNNGNGFQRSQANNGNGFQRSQANNGNGFQRSQVNNGNGFQRSQVNNGNGFQRSQVKNGNGFQSSQASTGNGFQRSQVNNGNGFQRSQVNNGNGFQRAQTTIGNGFQSSQASTATFSDSGFQGSQADTGSQEPFGAGSQNRYSSAAAPQWPQGSGSAPADSAVHPSQMVSGLALGGHMKKAGSAAAADASRAPISDTYLPPNN